jgi:hypothetical protein
VAILLENWQTVDLNLHLRHSHSTRFIHRSIVLFLALQSFAVPAAYAVGDVCPGHVTGFKIPLGSAAQIQLLKTPLPPGIRLTFSTPKGFHLTVRATDSSLRIVRTGILRRTIGRIPSMTSGSPT